MLLSPNYWCGGWWAFISTARVNHSADVWRAPRHLAFDLAFGLFSDFDCGGCCRVLALIWLWCTFNVFTANTPRLCLHVCVCVCEWECVCNTVKKGVVFIKVTPFIQQHSQSSSTFNWNVMCGNKQKLRENKSFPYKIVNANNVQQTLYLNVCEDFEARARTRTIAMLEKIERPYSVQNFRGNRRARFRFLFCRLFIHVRRLSICGELICKQRFGCDVDGLYAPTIHLPLSLTLCVLAGFFLIKLNFRSFLWPFRWESVHECDWEC